MYLIEKFYFSFQIFLLPEKSYQIAREIKKDKKIQIKNNGFMKIGIGPNNRIIGPPYIISA